MYCESWPFFRALYCPSYEYSQHSGAWCSGYCLYSNIKGSILRILPVFLILPYTLRICIEDGAVLEAFRLTVLLIVPVLAQLIILKYFQSSRNESI